ncbi:hypothetical protein LBK6_00380 [Leptospira borgpetersenii serovar Hardjo]|nr:hypothetical protein LBK6_00380 [Leptospira borgpetersenii serovar Hardjo]AWV68839.1 hypothetical protein B9T54_00440 [Leptospira borgpetersenii serovar Hardjo-bovis]TQE51818.1 hypothetical protein FFZ95_12695 [Leptospira borgpetersenii]AMX60139.1 hypothetical protein LBK9_00380 [Leptospira borgpetersenii serovar Hardjo]AYR07257.1 hypothetical protein D1609_00440 [Leptospira borgpetersenii serovar Hardjo-bovis]
MSEFRQIYLQIQVIVGIESTIPQVQRSDQSIGSENAFVFSTGLLDSVESRISYSELSYVQESY